MEKTNRKSAPTMVEVSKEAGVSVATVSRVVNERGGVSKKLEQRVHQAMKKLNYHPSSLARSFKKQQTMTIGVMIPLLDHPFYSRLASSIEKMLFNNGYHALICNAQEDEEREKAYIEMLLRQRVDGVIVNSSAENTAHLLELNNNNMQVVLIDRNVQGIECNRVFSDNSQGGFIGMQHLIELGHRQIGVIAAPRDQEPIERRLRGLHEAQRAYGIDRFPDLLITDDTQDFDVGYQAAKQLLQHNPRPTAIFALTDVMAVGVMHAANEMNLRIPDDLSVMGYDDIPIASYTIPPLSTVAQPIVEMGRASVELLLHHLGNSDMEPETTVLETHLVIRQTTAPPHS